jgi:hypothetical protein
MKKSHDMDSIIDLEDMREKVLHLWRYHQKTILNMKYSSWNLYQHPYLRTNQMILNLVIYYIKNKNILKKIFYFYFYSYLIILYYIIL